MKRISASCLAMAVAWVAIGQGAVFAQNPVAAPPDDTYLEKLIGALQSDESYKVRLQAAVFLGRSGDLRAVKPLTQSMNEDAHYTVRGAAATALGNLGDTASISHIIKSAATDSEAFVREEAARGLRKYERTEALPWAVAAYGWEDDRVRRVVVTYLAEGPFEAGEVVFLRALGDADDIARVVQDAVVGLPADRALRFLETGVQHRDPGVRRGAVQTLHRLASQSATEVILRVYERDIEVDEVRMATRQALRELRRFLPIEEIVERANNAQDKHARARALKLLGVIGGVEAEKALLKTLEDGEIYLRGTAVMALRELGNPHVSDSLEKLLRDPSNQRIKLQIRTALKHLKRIQEEQSPEG